MQKLEGWMLPLGFLKLTLLQYYFSSAEPNCVNTLYKKYNKYAHFKEKPVSKSQYFKHSFSLFSIHAIKTF